MISELGTFRGVERLAIVAIAAFAMWIGYRLFRLGIETEQKASLQTGRWVIRMESVGPGVFFAALATVVLVYALKERLESSGSNGNGGGGSYFSLTTPSPSHPNDRSRLRELTTSLTTVIESSEPGRQLGAKDTADLQRAISVLATFRFDILLDRTGLSATNLNNALRALRDNEPPTDSASSDQEHIKKVREWLYENE